MSEMEQRSDDWFSQRQGKCTASEIYKILGVRGFGETGETYTFDKACEMIFGLPSEEERIDTFRNLSLYGFIYH